MSTYIYKYQYLDKFIYSFLILLSILFINFEVKSQEKTIEALIEEIASNSDEELDYTSLYDDLLYYSQNKLNLNSASREDLEKLHFINDVQIENILNYIAKNGNFLTIYELQLIKGLSRIEIFQLLPFVTVGETDEKKPFNLKKAIKYGRHSVFLRSQFLIEEQLGFSDIHDTMLLQKPNSRYKGNRMKYYLRYKYNYKNKIQWGMTAEKDPGEAFFKDEQKYGFDYYSAHLQLNDFGVFKRIAIGDFQTKFGQGLVLWSGMSGGKSSYVLNILKKSQGIRKYSSTDENKFMRGIASTVKYKNFELTGFYSRKKIDANISDFDTLENEIREVSSFQTTGYHTTQSELDDKHAITEMVYGGNLLFRQKKFKLGLTFANYEYDTELNKTIKPYNQYEFSGNHNYNFGFDYYFIFNDIVFFGESAISQNGGMAFINGALLNPAPQVSFSVVQRHYQKNYQAYYSGAFAESSKASNENGLYIGAQIHPYKYWKLSVYFDSYKFPWLKSRANAPSKGVDYFAQLDYRAARRLQMYLKFKREIKQENLNIGEQVIKTLENVDKNLLRFHISYGFSRYLKLKNRIEISKYKRDSSNAEEGYVIYQDINYQFRKIPLKINFRYALFDSPYNSRIYAYENDILYGFSIPAYSGKGTRYYITMKYTITKKIDMWLRFSQFHYVDRKVISSGLNEINGQNKSEVKIQFRIKI